jgi:hypothetical protein
MLSAGPILAPALDFGVLLSRTTIVNHSRGSHTTIRLALPLARGFYPPSSLRPWQQIVDKYITRPRIKIMEAASFREPILHRGANRRQSLWGRGYDLVNREYPSLRGR